jgi:hypothetical protein
LRNKQKAWRLGAQVLNQLRRTVTGHVPAARAVKDIAAAAAPLARRTRSSVAVRSTLRPEIADPGVVNFFGNVDLETYQFGHGEAPYARDHILKNVDNDAFLNVVERMRAAGMTVDMSKIDHATFQAALNEAGFEEGTPTGRNAAAH